MKKIILPLMFLSAFFICIISVNSTNKSTDVINALLLKNIEALANSPESGGNWIEGYKMQQMDIKVGCSIEGSVVGVVGVTPSLEMGTAVTFHFETIRCCKKDAPGTDCNKDGNMELCAYMVLD